MSNPNSFWQPLDLIVDLFTREGRRSLGGFLLLALTGALAMIASVFIIYGRWPY